MCCGVCGLWLTTPLPPLNRVYKALRSLYIGTLYEYNRGNMVYYNKKLKQEIRQLKLDTIALKRIRKEMEEELKGELRI